MSPYEFYMQYRNMNVGLIDGTTIMGLDVHQYRNATDYSWKPEGGNKTDSNSMSADFDVDAGMDIAYAGLKQKIRKYGQNLGSNQYRIPFPLRLKGKGKEAVTHEEYVTVWPDLARCFFGKGSPLNMRRALRLAAAFGLVAATKAAMQKYCDDYFGLDCSGFAGNYLIQEGSTDNPDGKRWTDVKASQFAPEGNRLARVEDIGPGNMLVWKSGKHVAVVDRVVQLDGNKDAGVLSADLLVCESTGEQMVADGPSDGMNYTKYIILRPNDQKLFTVQRSRVKSKGGKYFVPVYVSKIVGG